MLDLFWTIIASLIFCEVYYFSVLYFFNVKKPAYHKLLAIIFSFYLGLGLYFATFDGIIQGLVIIGGVAGAIFIVYLFIKVNMTLGERLLRWKKRR